MAEGEFKFLDWIKTSLHPSTLNSKLLIQKKVPQHFWISQEPHASLERTQFKASEISGLVSQVWYLMNIVRTLPVTFDCIHIRM